MGFYRDALESIEKSMYPGLRQKYFKMAHESIVNISEDETNYHQGLLDNLKKKIQITNELKSASGSKEHINKFKDPEGVALKVINKILKEKNIDNKRAESFKDKLTRGKSFWNSEGKNWGDETSESDDLNSPKESEKPPSEEKEDSEETENLKITFGDIDNV